jgi:hypothetical protein
MAEFVKMNSAISFAYKSPSYVIIYLLLMLAFGGCAMLVCYRALVQSGVTPWSAWPAVFFANFALRARTRQDNLAVVIMQRREVCQIKDSVIEMFNAHLNTEGRISNWISESQLADDLYRRAHHSKFLYRAIKELLKEHYLERVPSRLRDTLYSRTRRSYIPKTFLLTEILTKMGVYARAMREHEDMTQLNEHRL